MKYTLDKLRQQLELEKLTFKVPHDATEEDEGLAELVERYDEIRMKERELNRAFLFGDFEKIRRMGG